MDAVSIGLELGMLKCDTIKGNAVNSEYERAIENAKQYGEI